MSSQLIIFDRAGRPLGYLRASVQRWWSLNEYGQAVFEIAINDPKCGEKYLRFGNLILIRRAGLPDWGGVIDTPRDWDYSRGVVTVNAYSGEYLLSYRRPADAQHAQTLKDSPGAIFSEIIAIANRAEDLNIRLGVVEDDGKTREAKLVANNQNGLYDDVCKLAEDSGFEWDVSPRLDEGGRLYFVANWRKRRGVAKTFVLRDGEHLAGDVVLSEQGKIINDLLMIGDGNSSKNTAKYNPPVDEVSRAAFGLRQGSETIDAKESESTLQVTAETRLAYWKAPRGTLSLTVLDQGKAFENLDVGNTLPVVLARAGFAAQGGFGWIGIARIVGMDYADDENNVELSCAEVQA